MHKLKSYQIFDSCIKTLVCGKYLKEVVHTIGDLHRDEYHFQLDVHEI